MTAPWRIIEGDCLDVLRALPAGSAHTIVTSPPYFGLRDYDVPATVWGATAGCAHEWTAEAPRPIGDGAPSSSSTLRGNGHVGGGPKARSRGDASVVAGAWCGRCGGWRGCLGHEPTPDLYVAHLVEVFAAVWRVLRDDGTCWLNIGDSYADRANGRQADGGRSFRQDRAAVAAPKQNVLGGGVKQGDLLGVPWMVAFALRAAGWFLRSEVIWAKPNPMPESVTSRPTKAHEQIFLLAKSGAPVYWTHRAGRATRSRPAPDYVWRHQQLGVESLVERPVPWRRVNLWQGRDYYYDADAIREPAAARTIADGREPYSRPGNGNQASAEAEVGHPLPTPAAGRNKRSVWEIATRPYPGAHFATFPTGLAEPCVLAGAPARACETCGAPWVRVGGERVLDLTRPQTARAVELADAAGLTEDHIAAVRAVGIGGTGGKAAITQAGSGRNTADVVALAAEAQAALKGYVREFQLGRLVGGQVVPSCSHGGDPVPGVVLDPFGGAATTGLAAVQHGRAFVGIELSPTSAALGRDRLESFVRLGFRSPAPPPRAAVDQGALFEDEVAGS